MGLILGGEMESADGGVKSGGGGVKSAGGGAGITGVGGKRLFLRLHFRLRALLFVHRRQSSCLHESHTVSFRRQLYHTRTAAANHRTLQNAGG